MGRFTILLASGLMALMLMSCEPCPYHSHGNVEISDEGFTVSVVDGTGGVLALAGADWKEEDGSFILSVDYGVVDHDALVSVHVDGIEVGTIGTTPTFAMTETAIGKDFTFSDMPKGRHIILLTVYESGSAAGSGSLEMEVDVPLSIGFQSA